MSGRTIIALCAFLTAVPFARAQQPAPQPPAKSSAPAGLVLSKGTPVRLRFKRDLSSADAKPDDNIDFEVVSEVKVGELVVIAKGSTAVGKVTAVEAARRMGRGGKLDIEMDSVTLADGEKASLWAVKEDSGDGNVGENRPIVARTLVFGPVAPLLLVMEGADAMIPRDAEITGYVVDAMQLDPAKFTAPPTLPRCSPIPSAPSWKSPQTLPGRGSPSMEITWTVPLRQSSWRPAATPSLFSREASGNGSVPLTCPPAR